MNFIIRFIPFIPSFRLCELFLLNFPFLFPLSILRLPLSFPPPPSSSLSPLLSPSLLPSHMNFIIRFIPFIPSFRLCELFLLNFPFLFPLSILRLPLSFPPPPSSSLPSLFSPSLLPSHMNFIIRFIPFIPSFRLCELFCLSSPST
jgi:hypothetical protein